MSAIERFTFFLDDQDNRSLSSARIQDKLPASDRIRAAVQLWQLGGPAADQINLAAVEMRHDRLTSQAVAGRRIKITLVLGAATHRALALARLDDGVPSSERVRAALLLWRQDPEFRAAVDALAAELRQQRFAGPPAKTTASDPPRDEKAPGPALVMTP